jgi:hypothetical protein
MPIICPHCKKELFLSLMIVGGCFCGGNNTRCYCASQDVVGYTLHDKKEKSKCDFL